MWEEEEGTGEATHERREGGGRIKGANWWRGEQNRWQPGREVGRKEERLRSRAVGLSIAERERERERERDLNIKELTQ